MGATSSCCDKQVGQPPLEVIGALQSEDEDRPEDVSKQGSHGTHSADVVDMYVPKKNGYIRNTNIVTFNASTENFVLHTENNGKQTMDGSAVPFRRLFCVRAFLSANLVPSWMPRAQAHAVLTDPTVATEHFKFGVAADIPGQQKLRAAYPATLHKF